MEKAVRKKSELKVWQKYIDLLIKNNQEAGAIFKRALIYLKEYKSKTIIADQWV